MQIAESTHDSHTDSPHTGLTVSGAEPTHDLLPLASRVAAVTLAFWIMKILATTLGETAGDFISMTLNLGYGVGFGVTVAALAAILFVKVREEHFHPALFWTAIVATTTAGTEISDLIDRSLGLGYLWGSVILASALALILWLWHRRHHDLTCHAGLPRSSHSGCWRPCCTSRFAWSAHSRRRQSATIPLQLLRLVSTDV